ncbi:MAG: hypothetical protein MUO43_01130, partial [Desulfobacterales bacterium]|nr:hypothetical protein [Desulfobacterales bacterium]
MSRRNLIFISLFTAILVLVLVPPSKSQITVQTQHDGDLVAGRNVNMVADDIELERQNEPSIAVSTLYPDHLLAGGNDYRNVNSTDLGVTGDAWLGVYKSFDGGESWESSILYGAKKNEAPLGGYEAAADPTVRAGINGTFFYSGIAFDRKKNGDSVIFVSQW